MCSDEDRYYKNVTYWDELYPAVENNPGSSPPDKEPSAMSCKCNVTAEPAEDFAATAQDNLITICEILNLHKDDFHKAVDKVQDLQARCEFLEGAYRDLARSRDALRDQARITFEVIRTLLDIPATSWCSERVSRKEADVDAQVLRGE